jgi:hypothetical protein
MVAGELLTFRRRVADISEEHTASIIRIEKYSGLIMDTVDR